MRSETLLANITKKFKKVLQQMKASENGKIKRCQSNSPSTEQILQTKFSSPPKSTVDSEDVDYFSNLWDEWWNRTGRLRPLHDLNPLRTRLIREDLAYMGHVENNPNEPLKGLKILDVGCGGGILSECLAGLGAQTTGLDASQELIEVAKSHAQLRPDMAQRLSYVSSTVEQFSQTNAAAFDVVVASEVIEHVNEPEFFLKHCLECLKPNGLMFITTANRTQWSWLYAIILLENVFKVIPQGTHDWNAFITPEEVSRMLEKYNCEIKIIHGIQYNPFTKYWSKISSTSSFYALSAIKRELIVQRIA